MKKRFILGLMGVFLTLGLALGEITGYAKENSTVFSCPRWSWRGGQEVKMIEIQGKIKQFSPPVAILKTKSGDVYMRLGPWWFWRQQGYNLKLGENVSVKGYEYGDYFIPVKLNTATREIVLRDQQGFPIWRSCWGRYGHGCGNHRP
ncbi:hypothetical protein SAMN04488516_10460 [Desulfonauticus submarinus]|uniref:Uncharacterized protein n=1 Tax=Desulfonauticus submarinus TaxID=206665 RepID=A0A1H0D813_9BACT|nr:hypothetical protein [Desulfonauticus submarinus]SDN66116.1 hypothetical protein SAMN04488516_10460 [Desulfonauticus submarinus]